MSKFKVDVDSAAEHAPQGTAHEADPAAINGAGPGATPHVAADATSHAAHDGAAASATRSSDDFTRQAATVGVIAIGAALIESTLIPGIVIGVAAALAPKYLPKLGERVQPLFNGAIRGAYKLGRKARASLHEAQERVQDIAAEVKAEEVQQHVAPAATPRSPT
jgi:hypothetical protein